MSTARQAADQLDAIGVTVLIKGEHVAGLGIVDEGRWHERADAILLDFVPPEVSKAYRRLVERAGWWAHE